MTPAQTRAARGLINWTQAQLADAAKLGIVTVRNFEAGKTKTHALMIQSMRQALESAGVIFVPENGEGPGVRLRKGYSV